MKTAEDLLESPAVFAYASGLNLFSFSLRVNSQPIHSKRRSILRIIFIEPPDILLLLLEALL